APPQPDGLVEDLERRLIDPSATEQLAVDPPGRRSDFIKAVHFLDSKAFARKQRLELGALKAALVAHAAVERSEERGLLRSEDDDVAAGIQPQPHGLDGGARVGDVLEHVQAEDGIEGAIV